MRKKTQKSGEVRIIIAGNHKVGKSTILQVIGEALAAKGFSFEVSALAGDNPLVIDEYQMKRIGAITGERNTKIILEERQTYAAIDSTVKRGRSKIFGIKE
jgi:hypothetical protein